MILILIAIIVAVVVAAVLFLYADNDYGDLGVLAVLFGFIFAVGAGVSALVYVFAGWNWLAADYQAKIINREYGTHYTQEEVFYASDVIDTIRQLDRKRIEINGDLMRDKPNNTVKKELK